MRLSDIAQRLGMPKSTEHRILQHPVPLPQDALPEPLRHCGRPTGACGGRHLHATACRPLRMEHPPHRRSLYTDIPERALLSFPNRMRPMMASGIEDINAGAYDDSVRPIVDAGFAHLTD
jgi:IclR helix-turn-helix domain